MALGINRNILECKDVYIRKKFDRKKVLIETYWNVKITARTESILIRSINRNILECKVNQWFGDTDHIYGINRNILECKGKCSPSKRPTKRVLIETYWNVKPFPYSFLSSSGIRINRNILECKVNLQFRKVTVCVVLIETYWNVKRFTVMPRFGAMRINRNILECKGA